VGANQYRAVLQSSTSTVAWKEEFPGICTDILTAHQGEEQTYDVANVVVEKCEW